MENIIQVELQEIYCGLESPLPSYGLVARFYERKNEPSNSVKAGKRTALHNSTKEKPTHQKKYTPYPQHKHTKKNYGMIF
jgi:hypothetical protein